MVVNLCKRGTMSVCIGKSLESQKTCEFYEPSTYREQCMYWVFEEFCSSIEAQIDAAKSIHERNQDTINKLEKD